MMTETEFPFGVPLLIETDQGLESDIPHSFSDSEFLDSGLLHIYEISYLLRQALEHLMPGFVIESVDRFVIRKPALKNFRFVLSEKNEKADVTLHVSDKKGHEVFLHAYATQRDFVDREGLPELLYTTGVPERDHWPDPNTSEGFATLIASVSYRLSYLLHGELQGDVCRLMKSMQGIELPADQLLFDLWDIEGKDLVVSERTTYSKGIEFSAFDVRVPGHPDFMCVRAETDILDYMSYLMKAYFNVF
jgi:hypothetical protein